MQLSCLTGDVEISGKMTISSLETMDAMEYMAAVSREAKSLPNTFVRSPAAPRDKGKRNDAKEKPDFRSIEGTQASLEVLLSNRLELESSPSPTLLPSRESWPTLQVAEFTRLRRYLEECVRYGIGQKVSERLPVPAVKDKAGWHEFCLGRDEAEGNLYGHFEIQDDDSQDESNGSDSEHEELPDWTTNVAVTGHTPSVRLILQFDQILTRRLLSHLVAYFCDGWPTSTTRLSWIYALLARLEKPLHMEEQATLRNLIRECCKRRAQALHDHSLREFLPALNLVIVIAAFYFNQAGPSVMNLDSSMCHASYEIHTKDT